MKDSLINNIFQTVKIELLRHNSGESSLRVEPIDQRENADHQKVFEIRPNSHR